MMSSTYDGNWLAGTVPFASREAKPLALPFVATKASCLASRASIFACNLVSSAVSAAVLSETSLSILAPNAVSASVRAFASSATALVNLVSSAVSASLRSWISLFRAAVEELVKASMASLRSWTSWAIASGKVSSRFTLSVAVITPARVSVAAGI